MEFEITVIIPTYNHPTYIQYIIDNCIKPYTGEIFYFEIHDSSCNTDTEQIVLQANEGLRRKIKYTRYDSNISGDLKSYTALCKVQTSHMFLMGDGIAPDFNKYEQFLLEHNCSNMDLLGMFPVEFKYSKKVKRICSSDNVIYSKFKLNEFFEDYFYLFTLYGASIVSKKIYEEISKKSIFEKYKFKNRLCYAYVFSLFDELSCGNYNFAISFIDFFHSNPLKKESTWTNGAAFFDILIDEYQSDLFKLPGFYDEFKKNELKNQRKYALKKLSIIHFRIKGCIKIEYIKNHKKELKQCKYNYYFMWIVSLIPYSFWKMIHNIKRKLTGEKSK